MTKRTILTAYEMIKFQLYSTEREKDLMKRNYLTNETFSILYNRLHKLDCFFLQLDLITKHYYLVQQDIIELENNSSNSQDILEQLNQKMKQSYPLIKLGE